MNLGIMIWLAIYVLALQKTIHINGVLSVGTLNINKVVSTYCRDETN